MTAEFETDGVVVSVHAERCTQPVFGYRAYTNLSAFAVATIRRNTAEVTSREWEVKWDSNGSISNHSTLSGALYAVGRRAVMEQS
jgi:hypothetical protein